MDLIKAFNMKVEWMGKADPIKVDSSGFVCLTDMVKFFPKKRLRDWESLGATREFLEALGKDILNSDDSRALTLITKRRGRYEGGTYAHELVAMEFATWLSPEFKIKVYRAYVDGSQRKTGWNIKRILAAYNYKIMCDAVADGHDPAKHYHYSNEALMINEIVFGERSAAVRDKATEEQLDHVAALEGHNGTMIELGMPYEARKGAIKAFYIKRTSRALPG